jgi:hypothetical protein
VGPALTGSPKKNEPNSGQGPESGIVKTYEIERSVHADVMAQPFDLVLHLQFSSFEFHNSQVIDRGMGQAFGDFFFERLMSFLQFRKVRLHRHAVCLLNQWLSTI